MWQFTQILIYTCVFVLSFSCCLMHNPRFYTSNQLWTKSKISLCILSLWLEILFNVYRSYFIYNLCMKGCLRTFSWKLFVFPKLNLNIQNVWFQLFCILQSTVYRSFGLCSVEGVTCITWELNLSWDIRTGWLFHWRQALNISQLLEWKRWSASEPSIVEEFVPLTVRVYNEDFCTN